MRRRGDESGRDLRDDESALWLGVTRTIKPLRGRKAASKAASLSTNPTSARASPAAEHRAKTNIKSTTFKTATLVPRERPDVRPAPSLAPIDRRTKHRLARGTEAIDARLDLHGLTQGEAHAALMRFLRNAQSDGMKFVLVITGKGRVGAESGVLRREVPRWLKLGEFRAYVVGYESAHVGHGGDGALYIRLRKAR
jgi:DNA-nicking Smr family endonuclease